jgi:hypothetical protein
MFEFLVFGNFSFSEFEIDTQTFWCIKKPAKGGQLGKGQNYEN